MAHASTVCFNVPRRCKYSVKTFLPLPLVTLQNTIICANLVAVFHVNYIPRDTVGQVLRVTSTLMQTFPQRDGDDILGCARMECLARGSPAFTNLTIIFQTIALHVKQSHQKLTAHVHSKFSRVGFRILKPWVLPATLTTPKRQKIPKVIKSQDATPYTAATSGVTGKANDASFSRPVSQRSRARE